MDKHNKNEHSIVLRPYVDYRDPHQRDPYKPKPDSSSGYAALMGLAGQAAQQNFSQLAQMQQGQFGQGGVRNWPFGGLF